MQTIDDRAKERTSRVGAGVIDRRAALASLVGGIAWATLPRAGRAQAEAACVLTPDSGEGPFYFDPKLARPDIRDARPGLALAAIFQVVREGDCRPISGARVDVWHADALGFYSGYERQTGTGEPSTTSPGQAFLRGTQSTDSDGRVEFHTIYPSWYRGRTPHLHFKIFIDRTEVIASQAFFPDDVNESVFTQFEPYRSVYRRRDTFNSTDRFLREGTQGAFCTVEQHGDSYSSHLVVAVRRT